MTANAQNSNDAQSATAPRRSFLPFLLGLPIAFLCIGFILMVFQYKQVKTLVSDKPGAMESLPVSPEEQERVLQKVKAFVDQPNQPAGESTDSTSSDTLVLNEVEVNHLVRLSPAIAENAATYRLHLQDTLVTLVNVMPAAKLQGPVAWMVRLLQSDGWLNSTMQARIDLEKSRVKVTLVKATMNDVVTPVSSFNKDNRLDPHRMAADTASFAKAIRSLNGLKIKDSRLVLIK